MYLQSWMLFVIALSLNDSLIKQSMCVVPTDTTVLKIKEPPRPYEEDDRYSDNHRFPPPPPHHHHRRPPPPHYYHHHPEDDDYYNEGPTRQNDKFSSNSYPYVRGGGPGDRNGGGAPPTSNGNGNGNGIRDDYPDERIAAQNYPRRCSERLEDALEEMRRKELAKKQSSVPLKGYSLHQTLRTEPVDMYVTDIRVRMPTQIKVDTCLYHPRNQTLDTSLLFNDLTISGKVNLFGEGEIQRNNRDTCNMILRLRRAGIGFYTEPIRPQRDRGQFNVRTDSHFLEPGFISVYAYGCEPKLRQHRRTYNNQRRQGGGHEDEENDELDDEEVAREVEDIFLKGIRSLLTSYMQRQLQPAIKETLMTNMGYTVSYG